MRSRNKSNKTILAAWRHRGRASCYFIRWNYLVIAGLDGDHVYDGYSHGIKNGERDGSIVDGFVIKQTCIAFISAEETQSPIRSNRNQHGTGLTQEFTERRALRGQGCRKNI